MNEKMKPTPLTSRQIEWHDEMWLDEEANRKMFEVAMNTFANRHNEAAKKRRQFWREMAELHDLDLEQNVYSLKMIEGKFCIVLDGRREEDDE